MRHFRPCEVIKTSIFSLAFISALSISLPAPAQVPDEAPIFEINTDQNSWSVAKIYQEMIESKAFGGSTWTAIGFYHNGNSTSNNWYGSFKDGLWYCLKEGFLISMIQNSTSLTHNFKYITLTVEAYDDENDQPSAPYILITKRNDIFDDLGDPNHPLTTDINIEDYENDIVKCDFTKIDRTISDVRNSYFYTFGAEIILPETFINEKLYESLIDNLYYRISFPTEKSKSNKGYSFKLTSIKFYGDMSKPVVTKETSGDKTKFNIVSNYGDLHVIYSLYDDNNQFVKEMSKPSNMGNTRASEPDYGDTWENKVADAGKNFTIEAPESGYYRVHAKSVSADGKHSEELVTYLSKDGILTSSTTVYVSPEEKEKVWYNLQGQQIENPSNGVFILIKNGKAVKKLLK